MRMIIEAPKGGNAGCSEPIRLAEFERAGGELTRLGLYLAKGQSRMVEAQRALVNAQAHVFVAAFRICPQCGAALPIKANHAIRYRTVFGEVSIPSTVALLPVQASHEHQVIRPAGTGDPAARQS